MKLSQKDKDILSYIYFRGEASVSEISKATDLKDHTVRYALEKFKENNLLTFNPIVNPLALGYTPYQIFFTCLTPGEKARTTLRNALMESERVYWVGGAGDPYNFDMILYSITVNDLKHFFVELEKNIQDVKYSKKITAITGIHFFMPKYLKSNVTVEKYRSLEPTGRIYSLDELDHRILTGLTSEDYTSATQLSKLLEIPNSTLANRLENLKKHKVITGYFNWIDFYKTEATPYKLLLDFEQSHKMTQKLLTFSIDHPEITAFKEGFGAFDYQVSVAVLDTRDIENIVGQLKAAFVDELSNVTLIPTYDNYKLNFYPFESYGLLESIR